MKRTLLIMLTVVAVTLGAIAGVNITKVDKVAPTQEMFMDMAVTAARKSMNEKGKPCGAVVILNGAWRSTGIPADGKTAEEVALEKSRRQTLAGASVYTVNEPTVAAYNSLCKAGVDAIYFVNPRQEVIAAGIYTEADYDDSAIDTTQPQVPMICLPYDDAKALLTTAQ